MMQRETPPTLSSRAFNNCEFVKNNTQGIYVPAGTVEAYKTAWPDWADYITDDIAAGTDWTLAADGKLTISSHDGMIGWMRSRNNKYNETAYKLLVRSVELQSGVTVIGDSAFMGCTSLTDIMIPNNVINIAGYAFEGCTSLKTVIMQGETPPTLSGYVFKDCGFVKNNEQGIRVPAGKEQAYKDAWTDWADYITDQHKHDNVTLAAWTETDSLPASGAYYLTKDVTVSSQTTISGTLTLCLNGCKIDAKQSGRIFKIESGGSLTLYDCGSEKKGTLTGGSINDGNGGGAIYVDGGSFTMNGGTISGNTAQDYGGAIDVNNNASFTMNGGKISGNTATYCGGGIYVGGSSFTMNNGEISGNTATSAGGGVGVAGAEAKSTGRFIMNGGKISGNTAVKGGGVHIYNNGAFTMSGGAISGNTADNGGLYAAFTSAQKGSVTLNGPVDITGNTKTDGTAGNIYLDKNLRDSNISKLTIGNGFSANTPIGVSIVTSPTSCANPVIVATGTVNAEVYEKFTSEMSSDSGCSLGYTNSVIQFELPHEYDNDSDMICNTCGYDRTPPDIQPPTGKIEIEDNSWTSFLNAITFGLFFDETKQVTITAEDTGSGVDKVYYYISDSAMTEAQVKALGADAWTEGHSFSVTPDRECVIYAKITDKAGNTTYLSSDGLVFDATPPVINGVTDGGTYHVPQTVTVTDALSGVKSVTVNGTKVTLADNQFTLGLSDNLQTIVATDNAGNTTTVAVTVKVQSHTHNFGNWQHDDTQHWKVCSCGEETGRGNHDFGNWITDKEATAAEVGTKHRDCQTCACRQTGTIPATGTPSPQPTITPSPQPTVTPSPQPTVTPSPQPTVTPPPQPTNTPKPDESKQTGNQIEKRKDLSLLLATGKQSGKSGIKLNWTKCKNISGYEVFWSYCDGRNNYKKAKTIKADGKRTWTHRKLKTKRTYKYFVAAYKMVDGKKYYITKSPVIHVAMKYDRQTNIRKIKVNKSKISLKKGKTFRIKAKLQLENRKKKALSHVAKLRYYTNNSKAAVVSKKGKITAKGKGICTIYVIANNGVTKKIKITVK